MYLQLQGHVRRFTSRVLMVSVSVHRPSATTGMTVETVQTNLIVVSKTTLNNT